MTGAPRSFAGSLLLLGACGADSPAPPLPIAATATGVEVIADGWSAAAATLQLAAGEARAGDVALVKNEPGRPPLQITAARSDWDLRARSAHFEGDVRVVRGVVEIRCARLDVQYADAETIDRVLATGGVEVRRGERVATSARAELVGATGRVTLTGAPRLAEGPNTLAGTTIVLWLDDERATCEGSEGEPCRLVVDGTALP